MDHCQSYPLPGWSGAPGSDTQLAPVESDFSGRSFDHHSFLFSGFFRQAAGLCSIYGLVLMPIGAVVLAEHWIFPALQIPQFQAEKNNRQFNWKALGVWVGTLVICYFMPLHLYFRWLPGYLLALIAYTLLHYFGKNKGFSFQKEALG
jgi:NCS1 family nucleobase:cation symporter-1